MALGAIITDCNADVNLTDANGWSALHHAASNGDIGSAMTLLDDGAHLMAISN